MEEPMRLKDAVRSHLDYIQHIQNVSPITLKQREYTLRRFQEDMGVQTVENITNFLIEEWIVAMRKLNPKIKGRTVNVRLSHIKSFLRWCDMRDMPIRANVEKIPKIDVVPPKHNYFDSNTIKKVLESCDQREELIISLLFDSMMRRAEVARLHVSQIKGRRIEYVGKGRKECTAVISDRTVELLDAYIERNSITGYIFTSVWSESHLDPDRISLIVKRVFARNGIENGHAHALRHSGATELETNGAPIQLISKLLNHTNIATTQIYTHATESNLLNLKDKYSINISGLLTNGT